jgi:exodeoxyribonuclease III
MTYSICSWNINSVRLRIDQVMRLLEEQQPDVLCLQETKCPDMLFPLKPFMETGYKHITLHGQKGYHGVAIVSKHAHEAIDRLMFAGENHARHVSVVMAEGPLKDVVIHNFYVPAGGDIPDPELNSKFAHKLAFVRDLAQWGPAASASPAIMLGDLNIAPYPSDVWSHKQLLKIVSHTPVETEGLLAAQRAGNWIDTARHLTPEPEPIFTWWSYRSPNWQASNRGRRLDHIWASPHFAANLVANDVRVETRSWERPSDHVPIITRIAV